ncbi:MAG: HAD family hydrolase [Erysipelotrichaceae bacterium]|nr:HAD family hydrolase [Erysipelotrichaceae bacterium]
MKYKGIFFDMDGTLLPMDTDGFTKAYISLLCKKLYPLGVNPDDMVKGLWKGVGYMVKNDGSSMNIDVFWKAYAEHVNVPRDKVEPVCDEFYHNEFKMVKDTLGENPLAVEAVKEAHKKAEHVVLATNPLFPFAAQDTRMEFVGLSRDDFDYVTAYDNSMYCKPNPQYYVWLLKMLNIKAEECLMIGNDEYEDMYAAGCIGMDTYLVTDCLLKDDKHPYTGKSGTFGEMLEYLKSL